MSLNFGTFGSFGEGTWRLITKACDPTTHPKAISDCDPWQLPGPKRDFILTLGFSLQRANSGASHRPSLQAMSAPIETPHEGFHIIAQS